MRFLAYSVTFGSFKFRGNTNGKKKDKDSGMLFFFNYLEFQNLLSECPVQIIIMAK